MGFLSSRDAVLVSFAEIGEAVRLAEAEDALPREDLPEIDTAVERARMGATLSHDELRAVLAVLVAARTLRRFLRNRRERCPALERACSTDPALDELAAALDVCFDDDGTLSDRASARLGQLRAEHRASRDRLIRRLEDFSRRYRHILQDDYWTERDGRYVLPVRADAHERFPGIVHATSDSGATLFVEPRVLVPMGNRHKMLESDVAREQEVVYVAMSAKVAAHVESLAGAASALAHADVRAATATLHADLDLSFPEVPDVEPASVPADEIILELRRARHPLLALDGVDVVASDVAVTGGRAMVVSGPNAGGKTVALKAMGLSALMVRAGLPVAAASGSRVSMFERVLTDVGDEQSLSKNLSTFSAHVKNIAHILDATQRGVLVLLDELASGTDPREGEVLATAILDSLCRRGGAVACTTHYEGLKVLALSDERFQNASVGFDMEQMRPTFKVAMGVPGASSALAVARRFGIPDPVVDRAEQMLSKETVTLTEMTDRLARERQALELAREAASREAEQFREQREELARERERLATKERASISKQGEELLESLRRAREELRAAQARLRSKKLDESGLRAAGKQIDGVAKKVSIGGRLEPRGRDATDELGTIEPAAVHVGLKVFVPRIRATAEVLEVLPSGQLRVSAGPLKLLTTVEEIRAAGGAGKAESSAAPKKAKGAGRKRKPVVAFDAAADPDEPIQTSDNTVDVRGLRAHEAVAMAEQFLDRCLGAGLRVAFLIHGHGTGALREAIRESLRESSYVERFRAAEPRGGGEGVTVVWLR